MKKILTTILVMIFCTCKYAWTAEIIVGSDVQAKSVNSIVQNDKMDTNNNFNSVNNNKGQIKMEKTNINVEYIDWDNPELIKYQQKLLKYTQDYYNISMHIFIFKLDTYIKQEGYKNDELILKAPLKDGDYVVLYKTKDEIYYAIEYHDDGSIMGLVVCVNVKKTNSEYIGVFYEHRYETDTESSQALTQKHVMIVDIEKDDSEYKIAQFVYNSQMAAPRSLLCYSVNNRVYIAEGNSNLLVDLTTGIDMQKNNMKNYQKDNVKSEVILTPTNVTTPVRQENKTDDKTNQAADVVFDKIEKGVNNIALAVGVGLMGIAGLGGLAVAAIGLPIILPVALYSYFKDK